MGGPRSSRLIAHPKQVSEAGTIREALACLPEPLAARLGPVQFTVRASDDDVASRWRWGKAGLEVEVNASETSPHDCALELLACLGQALWQSAKAGERRAWLKLLREEIDAGCEGEIDERALQEKQAMLSSPVLAASPRRLERYAEASFAATMAEYVHSLWHEVTVRSGAEHLALPWLRRRFALFSQWFPPTGNARLSPSRHCCRGRARRGGSCIL